MTWRKTPLTRAGRKLEILEDKLRKTKVISPMNGTILTLPVIEGQVVIAAASVNSGTSLMTIANLEKLQVETHINQVDVAYLQPNQKVKLRAESIKDASMTGRISFVAPKATVKNNIKGFQVQAIIENPNPRLRPGMSVNLTVPIARADSAVSVSDQRRVQGRGEQERSVYVRNGEATETREVEGWLSPITTTPRSRAACRKANPSSWSNRVVSPVLRRPLGRAGGGPGGPRQALVLGVAEKG
jgi:hypothetical protein